MLPFLHHRLQLLQVLLVRANAVFVKYTQFDLDLPVAVADFLDGAIVHYHDLGEAAPENELLALKAQFVSAASGTNPLTYERITSHRRDLMRAVGLLVLQQSTRKLRADTEQVTQKLEEGRNCLRPLVLLGMQKGIIPTQGQVSQNHIEELWRKLLSEPDMGLAARQVAMQLSAFDVYLLLAELIGAALSLTD